MFWIAPIRNPVILVSAASVPEVDLDVPFDQNAVAVAELSVIEAINAL